MTVSIVTQKGQRHYDAGIYYEHVAVVKVGEHKGDAHCATSSIRQIILNFAIFTTALNATKDAHISSNLLQKNLHAVF